MEALRWLRDSGVSVERLERQPHRRGSRAYATLDVAAGDVRAAFVVEEKGRAPYPNELPRLNVTRQALSERGHPLLVVPFVSEALGAALTEAGWSWADGLGNFDFRAPGLTLRQRRKATLPKPTRGGLPHGSGSLAIIRALIGFGEGETEDPGATALAGQARVSQPRASQVLRRLFELGLVDRSRRGRWKPHTEALLDRFLDEYRGPGGPERYFYGLESPTEVAVRAARLRSQRRQLAVSADVGPDLIVAWRRPTTIVLYAGDEITPEELGLIEAVGPHDGNVVLRIPEDRSVFPVAQLLADVRDVEVPLADPTQQIWDLQKLGGADRLEAAGRLREWLLKHR